MGKYHELDAPELAIGGSPVADNSALSSMYPDPQKDTRPLLKNDAARHALQQQRLNRSVDGVLKHGFSIALLQTTPFAYIALLGTFVFENLNAGTVNLMLPVIVIGSFLWIGVLVASYHTAMERLHRFGMNGLTIGIATLLSLTIGGFAVMPLASITDSLVLNSLVFSGYLLGIAVTMTYLLLFIALNGYHRGSGQG